MNSIPSSRMSSRTLERHPDFIEWRNGFQASPLGKRALNQLRELEIDDFNTLMELEARVLEECYQAKTFGENPGNDYFEQYHADLQEFKESIADLIKAAKRLRLAARAKPYCMAMGLLPVRHKIQMEVREGEDLPNGLTRTFAEILEGMEQSLLNVRDDARLSSGRFAGCLEYPRNIRNHRSADQATNGLIFSLVRLFRLFTEARQTQDRPPYTMPDDGRPCFDLVAKFVHATLSASRSEPRYAAEAISDKLKKLLKNYPGVSYVKWV